MSTRERADVYLTLLKQDVSINVNFKNCTEKFGPSRNSTSWNIYVRNKTNIPGFFHGLFKLLFAKNRVLHLNRVLTVWTNAVVVHDIFYRTIQDFVCIGFVYLVLFRSYKIQYNPATKQVVTSLLSTSLSASVRAGIVHVIVWVLL